MLIFLNVKSHVLQDVFCLVRGIYLI